MSVLVIAKFQGDTAKFRQSLADRGDEFSKIVNDAKTAGAIHHRFGIGDGFVVVHDEWDSAEHFRPANRSMHPSEQSGVSRRNDYTDCERAGIRPRERNLPSE